jgi:hypothetical protein
MENRQSMGYLVGYPRRHRDRLFQPQFLDLSGQHAFRGLCPSPLAGDVSSKILGWSEYVAIDIALDRMKTLALAVVLVAASSAASAGGSWEEVTVESLTVQGTSYELVVLPKPRPGEKYQDPYMSTCPRFTVKGDYSLLHAWRFPEFVTRANHKEALAYLQQAQTAKKRVLFGWVGTGFVPLGSDKCIVRSRALWLRMESETAVLSFHDAI